MVKPINDIAKKFEAAHEGINIIISQGGSEGLYQSLKTSKKGDLYLPGSFSYRERHFDEGLLSHYVDLGFNQAAMMVAKGNPKNISADLNNLYDENLSVVIASPEMGSIGRETKKILVKKGIYEKVVNNAIYQTSDSRTLNQAIKNGDADIIINWKATAYFEENKEQIDVIPLQPEEAKPKRLALNLLTFSKYSDTAKKFMELAKSPEGLAIFSNYGFALPDASEKKEE
ncbi:MAG: molybdate ABC transporter substrate-binding protein [gamma proteobacterium symbiont of Bathyaustriella thionipta]|nr:molybdate ABC transporter substrate-binding protein [gamma proteobacterium symbiont of Bathyaustriella thionipta]MCU7949832.1 molybdate ABC transporter substrate-binding protein [gamma proteobacterium symbiont of Bathyaustriella thionipta]MCU7954096.1 molybdate ABC transporter substrate-binding protein [gamma proteobacterium symbiont of Bathyaustriella thionipta]MCU7956406.1 molybdate ABC transporter substrate-binding protein [gamma proteobacterium symbiont of Bathyaustriella thionipta]MCU79